MRSKTHLFDAVVFTLVTIGLGLMTCCQSGSDPAADQAADKIDWTKTIVEKEGAIIRMDTSQAAIYLIFSGHDHNEGRMNVLQTLRDKNVKASFFFTGDFYRNPVNREFIDKLLRDDHYLGTHSDKPLLYADWTHRDSTLVSRDSFRTDLQNNYEAMEQLFGISIEDAPIFLPSYEWYNSDIAQWSTELGRTLINLTPGTGTARDYTWPEMGNRYTDSPTIISNLMDYEAENTLNGAILLIHLGTDPRRTDKLYHSLGQIIDDLTAIGYQFKRF